MGKISDLKAAARAQARTPAEVKSIIEGLSSMKEELATINNLPQVFQNDLEPLRRDVALLRNEITETIKATPPALASQLEPIRAEVTLLSQRIDRTQQQLTALPDVIAREVAPAVEALNSASSLQQELERIGQSWSGMLETQRATIDEMSARARQSLARAIKPEITTLHHAAQNLVKIEETAARIESAAAWKETWWGMLVQFLAVALVAVSLTMGSLKWLGILDSERQAQPVSVVETPTTEPSARELQLEAELQTVNELFSELPERSKEWAASWYETRGLSIPESLSQD